VARPRGPGGRGSTQRRLGGLERSFRSRSQLSAQHRETSRCPSSRPGPPVSGLQQESRNPQRPALSQPRPPSFITSSRLRAYGRHSTSQSCNSGHWRSAESGTQAHRHTATPHNLSAGLGLAEGVARARFQSHTGQLAPAVLRQSLVARHRQNAHERRRHASPPEHSSVHRYGPSRTCKRR